jgi:hypothetical protein
MLLNRDRARLDTITGTHLRKLMVISSLSDLARPDDRTPAKATATTDTFELRIALNVIDSGPAILGCRLCRQQTSTGKRQDLTPKFQAFPR